MTLPHFDHERAADLSEALKAVQDGAIPYCGGTELLGAMNLGLLRPDRLISLRGVAPLREVTRNEGLVRIGATVTHHELTRHPDVRASAPLLADVAREVGNVRVRATGTIGGNLAFAEPRSDLSAVLAALGAGVVVTDGAQERRLTVNELIVGPYEADLRPGELLVAVEVPIDAADVGVYRKITITERPVVCAALVHLRDLGTWRLVVGAVGEELYTIEVGSLEGLDPSGISGEVDVAPDHSGSATYKRRLTCATIGRCRAEAQAIVEERG